ncbi:hypothetical protein HD554DRAFT_1704278 [Boletus coccyginus]|nr:hypothetical protein HD554DRAFT_1704278 [Boletus coccyginus]
MDAAGKTLVEIASVSRRVFDTLVRYAGRKTVESFQLEKIVVASGAILETLNGALFLGTGIVDDRLKDWLISEGPRRCLDTLNRMETLLSPKPDGHTAYVKDFFRSSRPVPTKDKGEEAIRLFWKHEGYFYFLLSTEIWNRESSVQQLPAMPPQNALRIHEAYPQDDLTQRKVGGPSSMAKEKKTKQWVDTNKLNSIMTWLHAWSCNGVYERTLRFRQPDTCTWLPITNAFKTWRNTENSFL